jgi:ATP-dependent DNA helicase PIF1
MEKSTFFVNKNKEDHPTTIDDLRAAFEGDTPEGRTLLNSLCRAAFSITGTRPYWLARRNELESYVDALGCPDLFMTFSAADYHWDDLMRLFPYYEEWRAAVPDEKVKLGRRMLLDNLHVASWHYVQRFQAFMRCVLMPKFCVKDWWNRYEWQARGSPHDHGFVWSDSAPKCDVESEQSRREWAKFWGLHVSAINMDIRRDVQGFGNPLTVPVCERDLTFNSLHQILLKTEVHTCLIIYCMREKKQGTARRNRSCQTRPLAETRRLNEQWLQLHLGFAAGLGPAAIRRINDDNKLLSDLACRFYYPRTVREVPGVSRELNPKHWMFICERNDQRLTPYNETLSLGWGANLDISPCPDMHGVKNYMAKYCGKPEEKSASFLDLSRQILDNLHEKAPLLSFVSKFLNKLLAEMDWSQQEIIHHLLGLKAINTSRSCVNVDCRPEDQQPARFVAEDGSVRGNQSLLEKYKSRPPGRELDSVTYFDYLAMYDWNRIPPVPRSRALSRILVYFPRYKRDGSRHEDFCRVKMMLHHPFRDVSDVLVVDGMRHETYAGAYAACRQHHPNQHSHDYYQVTEAAVNDDEFEDGELPADEVYNSWEALAAVLPDADKAGQDALEKLGTRELDLARDWSDKVGIYPDLEDVTYNPEYWKTVISRQSRAAVTVQLVCAPLSDDT